MRNDRFEISIRTLQRDLRDLSVAFPITAEEQGRRLVWCWSRDATLFSIPSMDAYTALTFMLAESHLAELFPASIGSGLKPYFDAARKVLKKSGRGHLSEWKRKVRVIPRSQSLMPARIRPRVNHAVHDALLRDKRLHVRYRARDASQDDEWEINPLALVHRHGVSYLVCTSEKDRNVRQLALHRFRTARVLDKAIVKPIGVDLSEFWQSKPFDYPTGGKIDLDVLFDAGVAKHLRETPLGPAAASRQPVAKHLRETPLGPGQSLCKHPGGRTRLRINIESTSQLRWWLLGFGNYAEVVGPRELRAEFTRIARGLGEMYSL